MAREAHERRGIQSVGIGMRVLSVVSEMEGASTLSSIALKAEMSPSQAHRYLSSLIASGMVKQDRISNLYDLDAGAIRMGLAALSRLDVFANADRHVHALVKQTRRTGLVAVMGDRGPTVVRWFPGSPPVITTLAIGSVLPLFRSATGRIFHTFSDRAEMDRQAHLVEMSDPAQVPIDLAAGRAAIEASLVTTIAGDMTPGLRAMSGPVFDLQGRLVLAVTLLAGTAFRSEDDPAIADQLLGACRGLTESLGGAWPHRSVACGEVPPKARVRGTGSKVPA